MRIVFGLAVCAGLSFASGATADTTYVDLGSATGGRIIYCGTELKPTSVHIDLGTIINGADSTCDLWLRPVGDPEIERLGLVRLPFNPPPSQAELDEVKAITARPRSESEVRHAEVNARVGAAMTGLVQAYKQQHSSRAAVETVADRTALLQALMPDRARLYLESGHVDSVIVLNERVWRVKWRDTGWERMEISPPTSKPTLANKQANNASKANQILEALRAGQGVMIDHGYLYVTSTPSQRLSFDQDLIAMRNGNGTSSWFPRRVRERFLAQHDLRTIVQGGQQ